MSIVDLLFGIGMSIGLALFITSLFDGLDFEVLVVYFCWFMAIALYGGLVEFWMFLASFILMVFVIGFKLMDNNKGMA